MVLRKFATYHRQVHVMFLIGIYAAFFSVQLFFNFDSNASQQLSYSIQKNIQEQSKNKKQIVFYKKHTDDCKNKNRLNKRFQPNEFACIIPETVTVPYCIIDVSYTLYDSPLHFSFLLYSSLRGPPAIVA